MNKSNPVEELRESIRQINESPIKSMRTLNHALDQSSHIPSFLKAHEPQKRSKRKLNIIDMKVEENNLIRDKLRTLIEEMDDEINMIEALNDVKARSVESEISLSSIKAKSKSITFYRDRLIQIYKLVK